MKYVGIVIYFALRSSTLLYFRLFQFATKSYLKLRANSCGDILITGRSHFACVGGLDIGNNVGINAGAYWVCEGGLAIGDNCRFGRNSTIYTRNHNYHGAILPYDDTNNMKPVKIGNNVWVGINVTILPGAEIRDGAIIGAGSVVSGVVDRCEIHVAQQSHFLKHRDLEHYNRLVGRN